MAFQTKVGLALSGGGMRGMAHIGVIQALREYEIDVDIISGTSIGAIVGAMYAKGMSTEEMLNFFRNISIFSFRNYAFRKPGLFDPESYRKVLLDLFPDDSFQALEKELYVSVTNLHLGKNRLIESGSLVTALLCSAAIPGVFSPIKVGDDLYSDGGLTNNYPIEPLSSRCQFIIGSYVNPLKKLEKGATLKNTLALFDRAMVISTFRMELPSFHLADVFVMPDDLDRVPTLSLKHIDNTYKVGYEEASRQLEAYFTQQKMRESL